MKLVIFDDFRLGVLNDRGVVDITSYVKDIPHVNPTNQIVGLIEQFEDYRGQLQYAGTTDKAVPVSSVRLRPPIPAPRNIICMAVNYMENGTLTEPAEINAFQKPVGTIIGDSDTMLLPDIPATIFEGEAELAVVIGKRASNVKKEDALKHVFGYTNFIDGSARGVPHFYQMKGRETFAPIGPAIVTADEVPNPNNLQVQLWVNGTLMQNFNTDDMAHNVARCIEWVSSIHTLEPGDILATGTNHRGLNPFQDGDRVELEIERLGRLHVSIRDDLKRTWARMTRQQMKEKGLGATTPQLTGKYARN